MMPEKSPPFFFDWLRDAVVRNDSLLCVGLDPRPEQLAGQDVFTFNRQIINATADLVCAYKPNYAFYEALGLAGLEALQRTIAYAHDRGLPVILDAKRGDIGSTAAAYAHAAFEVWGADAVTVNPYLGWDSIAPFVRFPERGVLVLCHTSNPSAQELQTLEVEGRPLYQQVAQLAQSWNQAGNIGLVVGATYPHVLGEMRQQMPAMWFLVPGVGPQGGDLDLAVAAGLNDQGHGLIVNVARGVIYAADPRQAAQDLRERINQIRRQPPDSSRPSAAQDALVLALHDLGAVQFGEFRLKSGTLSPIYVDLRLLVSAPAVMRQVARAYAGLLRQLQFDRIAGIPYAALPIATAVGLEMNRPVLYPRKEVKGYGTGQAIEGRFEAGETVVVLDDLITTGGSKFEAIAPLEAAGLRIQDVVVLIDREQGGADELAAAGYRLHSVLTLSTILETLTRHGRISSATKAAVEDFLQAGKARKSGAGA